MQKVMKLISVMLVLFGTSVAYGASADNDRDRWDNNGRGVSAWAQSADRDQSRSSSRSSWDNFWSNVRSWFANLRRPSQTTEIAQVSPQPTTTPSVPELDTGSAAIAFGLLLALGGVVRERRRRQHNA